MDIVYALEPDISATEFVDVLERSSLAERRPVGDAGRIEKMLKNADVISTARAQDGRLIGVARAVTDFSFCCYLSDLAVDQVWQGKGIGTALMKHAHEAAGLEANFTLNAAPAAMDYYPKAGLTKMDNCFRQMGVWTEEG